jgi:hypothetical protein
LIPGGDAALGKGFHYQKQDILANAHSYAAEPFSITVT